MKGKCSICGSTYETFAFKGGFVCEDCLKFLKNSFQVDPQVRKTK